MVHHGTKLWYAMVRHDTKLMVRHGVSGATSELIGQYPATLRQNT